MKLRARNQLKATVKSVTIGAVMAEATVSIGDQEVVGAITRTSAESLALSQGDQVIVVIKSTDVMLAKA